MAASARFLERDAATLTRPLHLSEHQRRDLLRDSSTKTLLQSGAAQIFSRSAWSVAETHRRADVKAALAGQ